MAYDETTAQLLRENERLKEALREIALAGMSGTGMESEEAMRAWHARQAWKFIQIAARALMPDTAGVGGTAKLPPMGSASQSACGCYSYESEGVKTEHWCEKHSPFGVAVDRHQTFSQNTPADPGKGRE